MSQAKLSVAARAFRVVHGLITVAFLLAIVHVWWCALTGRPLFELVLSPAAARRAIPILGAVAGVGIVLLSCRSSPRG